jgi:hypothetical protein
MKHLKKEYYVWLFVVFSSIVGLVWVLLSKETLDWKLLTKIIPNIVTADLVLYWLFVNWIWRWKVLHGWFVPFPDLNGTWEGHIQTTWTNPATGSQPGPIPVILVVKQSFIRISCVMRTQEMVSRSYCADFILSDDDQLKQIAYVYRSSPKATVAHRSPDHDGTMLFDIVGKFPEKLTGTYWTARKTTGDVELKFRSKERLDEFPADLGPHPVSGLKT